MDDYSRMSLDSMDDHQGRAILSLSHQLPLCPCVVRPKNAIYPSSSSIFLFFLTRGPIWHVSIMAFRLLRQMPHGLSWLVTSLQMLNLVAYK